MLHRFRFLTLLALVVGLIALGIVSSGSGVNAAEAGNGAGEIIPGRYIVVLQDGVSPADVARGHGLAPSHIYTAALNGFAGRASPAHVRALAADPRVKSVEPDRAAHITDQTIPTGVDRIDVDLSSTASIDGVDTELDVDIAVIDTGVDGDHPDLRVMGGAAYLPAYWAIWIISCGNDGSWEDGHGHGTHVAGTSAGRDNDFGVVGVAPGARIWAVKVLGDKGGGCVSDIIKGVDWVTATRTDEDLDNDIEVANMSLSWQGNSPAARTAIQNSVATGVFYAVAAGNSATDVYGPDGSFGTGDEFEPASYPEVATIAAMADSDGQPGGTGGATSYGEDDSFASFSNFSGSVVDGNPVTSTGAAIDLLLPGVDILSTWKDAEYNTISGTSMSSPHAAGLAALHVAVNGAATDAAGVYAIRQALIDGAVAQDDPSNGLAILNDPDLNWEKIGWAGPLGPVDSRPSVSVTFPADGSTFASGATILFEGTASDAEDGDLTGSLAWTSTINGPIGTGGSFSTTLSDGTHTITASVTDSGGKTGSASISISVINDPPAVSITSPTDGSSFDSGATIDFAGTASDTEDGDVTADLVWTSSTDGEIGTDGSFSTTLSDGTHTITASVTDSGGKTGSASITITVGTPPTEPTTVSVSSITYTTEGGRNQDRHLNITVALVDDLGNPVSGASVSIDLYRAGSKTASGTGTTGSDGTVTFKLNNAPSGTYTTTVTAVSAAGLTWDGITPANSFTK